MKRLAAALLTLALLNAALCRPVFAANAAITASTLALGGLCVGAPKTFTETISGGGSASYRETASSSASQGSVTPTDTGTPANLRNGNVTTYTVSGVSASATGGNITVKLLDSTGAQQASNAVSFSSVNGPITVASPAPANINLTAGGAPASFRISDPGPNETVTATSDNTNVATVTSSSVTSGGFATYTVTSGNTAGTAHISLSGSTSGCTASSAVTVTVNPGTLTVTPATSYSLAPNGTATVTATETGYAGNFTINTPPNSAVATVTPSSVAGPSGSFTITGKGFGNTTFTINDNHGGSQTITVVVSGGRLSISSTANTIQFNVTDNTSAHLAAASGIEVTGAVQTTSSGSASISLTSPSSILGLHGGSIPISALTYSCTNNGGGGTFVTIPQFLTMAQSCASFANNVSANIDFLLNMFLDDRAIPADTYSDTTNFTVVLSAT